MKIALALSMITLFGCGNGSESPPDASIDAAVADQAIPDAAQSGGDAGTITDTTRVLLGSSRASPGVASTFSYAQAYFVESDGVPARTTRTTSGPCTLSTTVGVGHTGGSSRVLSAGAIAVGGLRAPITLSPVTQVPGYSTFQQADYLWSGGEPVSVSAPGAEVPAFSAQVIAPSQVTITAPALPAGGAHLAIDRAKDFPVAWSSGGSGQVELRIAILSMDPSSTPSYELDCDFPSSAGTAMVPSAALSLLPKDSGPLTFAALSRGSVAAGKFDVEIQLSSPAVWANLMSGQTLIVDLR